MGFTHSAPGLLARRIAKRVLGRHVARIRALPVNRRRRDASDSAIAADADYAIRVGAEYLALLRREGIEPAGKTILELGPGINFGSILLLAAHGSVPVVADRFLAEWDPPYHGRFHAALRARILATHPQADTTRLDRMIAIGGYDDPQSGAALVRRVRHSAEDLRGIADGEIDVTLSNAVLEHLQDPQIAFRELRRVSKSAAWGFHQVDFRDHRDFERPLEYLLLAEAEFGRLFAERHGECGGQWRPDEIGHFLREAGFEVRDYESNMRAPDSYLRDFEPKLRRARSRYRDRAVEDLASISGRFTLRAAAA